jgi:pentapeptide repeat protein
VELEPVDICIEMMGMNDERAEPPAAMSQSDGTAGRVLSNRVIAVSAVLLTILAGGLAWLLLGRFGDGSAANNARLDGIRTVGTIVLGAGGGMALLLAARRQQTAEQDLVHKSRVQAHAERIAAETQAHQSRVARAAEIDAAERRITDLYDKAVEKLGSEKAAVRFGGLYALERLAQHTPNQQAAVTKVLCAYLRMPYLPPGEDPGLDAEEETRLRYERRREEQGVRLAVQRMLANHLRAGDDPDNPLETFWAAAEIDLSGATLIGLNFNNCTLPCDAEFQGATFVGFAAFVGVTFRGGAEFDDVRFLGDALFESAIFAGEATFGSAIFSRYPGFERTIFAGVAGFDRTTFHADTAFYGAEFLGDVYFLGTVFAGRAMFDDVVFGGTVEFVHAVFTEEVVLDESVLADGGRNAPDLSGAIVRLDVPIEVLKRRQWPATWSVVPLGPDELEEEDLAGAWGVLVRQ